VLQNTVGFRSLLATELYDREKAFGGDLAIVHSRQPATDVDSGRSGTIMR
jgi:hypothetical protein